MVGLWFSSCNFRERDRQPLMIERFPAQPRFHLHDYEFLRAIAQIISIPEPGIVPKPVGINLSLIDPAFGAAEPATSLLSCGVDSVGGSDRLLTGSEGLNREQQRDCHNEAPGPERRTPEGSQTAQRSLLRAARFSCLVFYFHS